MKHLFNLLFVLMASTAIAQSTLTVFSNETEFILFVNGVKKNATHETSVKTTGITADFVKLKVLLKDAATPEVTTSATLAPQDDAVFELKKNKKGKYVLRFVSGKMGMDGESGDGNIASSDASETPQVTAEIPESDATNETISTTVQNVQTTNASSGNITMNAGTQAEGVSINMTMTIPQENISMQTSVTTTTTTTTTSSRSANNLTEEDNTSTPSTTKPLSTNCAFSYIEFKDAVSTIKGSTFGDTQLATAKQIIKNRCLTVNQSIEIINIFSMEDMKLGFAKYVYDYISDKNQCFKTLNAFSFDGSKREYNEYLESKR